MKAVLHFTEERIMDEAKIRKALVLQIREQRICPHHLVETVADILLGILKSGTVIECNEAWLKNASESDISEIVTQYGVPNPQYTEIIYKAFH